MTIRKLDKVIHTNNIFSILKYGTFTLFGDAMDLIHLVEGEFVCLHSIL